MKTIIGLNQIVILALGIPGYIVSQSRKLLALWHYALGGLLLGLVVIVFLSHNFVYVIYIVFGVAGALQGVLFWFIAIYEKPLVGNRRGRSARRRRRRYR